MADTKAIETRVRTEKHMQVQELPNMRNDHPRSEAMSFTERQAVLKEIPSNEEREWYLVSLIYSPFLRASTVGLVGRGCGLSEARLRTITKELNHFRAGAYHAKMAERTVDDMYMVAAKIHSNKTGAVMCIDQAFGTETSVEEHYRTILGELSLLAQDRQTLSKLPPGFLAKHMLEPAKELVTSDPARYGWLASCILLDCTDEHVQGTNDSAGHRRLLSTKPHTSSPALTYLRAHLFDLWALWTSRGHPPNDFHHDGQTNVDTEVAVVDSFWDELIGLAQSQGVAVIHVLADKVLLPSYVLLSPLTAGLSLR